MKKLFKISLLALGLVFASCKKEMSLQSYLVESQKRKNVVNIDLPASIIQLSLDKASEADKKAYESIRKVNITGIPANKIDEVSYETEKNTLKTIFKNSDYKKLMNFKKNGANITLYYLGAVDAIDEIVAFAYGENMGVGVARVLGEHMNPQKILSMINNAKIDEDRIDLAKFSGLFGNNDLPMEKRKEIIEEFKKDKQATE